jgi:uncharacterized repeat protein (TIGR01451 family)
VKKFFSSLACLLLPLLYAVAASGISVPPGTSIDNQASAIFQPSTGGPGSANSNIVHVIAQPVATGASLTISKSVSQPTANPGDQPTFTLNVVNSGSADAAGVAVTVDGVATTGIVVRDAIPSNTRFLAVVNASPARPVYHLSGSPVQTYVSAAPADLSTVDAAGFLLNTFAAGANFSFSFKVAVAANASGVIRNTALVFYNNGADTSALSNESDITVNGPAPGINYYFDNNFKQVIHATPVNAPLWVQVDAAACNLDPNTAETKIVTIQSSLTGDAESFTATETGVNTGVFRVLPSIPTRDASVNPAVSGNHIMEVLKDDHLVASLSGCGATGTSAVILIDPSGVVFDSHSNALVAGAQVTLIDVSGDGNGGHPNAASSVFQFDGITPAASTVTTGADGRYQFPQVLPSTYRVLVKPPANFVFPSTVPPGQLPAGRVIDTVASYGGNFIVNAGGGAVVFDVPVDTSGTTALFVQKTVSRPNVELGEFVDYTVEVKNLISASLPNVQVTDTLPPGFAYQKNTARVNGAVVADPAGGKGPVLTFNIGNMAANADVKISYRVLVGPGSATGNAFNHAVAVSGSSRSNTASARVVVTAGLLGSDGFIVGKVFQDCNGNHLQDKGELGIPGVRIYLDDGTFAITDADGKYSLYGVPGRTHILKVDNYSLPPGSQLLALSSRNAGDGGSRFIDLKFGEMQKADFALGNCTSAMASEINLRRAKLGNNQEELIRAVKAQFNADNVQKDPTQLKSLAASGFVDSAAADSHSAASAAAPVPAKGQPLLPAAKKAEDTAPGAEFAGLTNQLGFVDLHNQDVLSFTQTNIRIKGALGATLKLLVNGEESSAKQVGNKTLIADKQLQVWEFIGVNLHPGKNEIEAVQVDPYGNVRGVEKIELIAPSKLGRLKIEMPKTLHPADGKSTVKVTVRLTDASDVPVTVRTPLTLEATNGTWLVKDLNPREPGTQVFIEGGHAEFELLPPIEPGSSLVRVSSGGVSTETKIEFVPELRPMLAAGLVEYQINFGAHAQSAVQPSLNDGFESQLQLFSAQSGEFDSGGHAVLLLKGKIKGENLLTLSYDSEKTTQDRLFRDIQPDQFYPVYGDASVRGYDAQSTSKAYLRIDHGRTYVMYGDFLTTDPGINNSLGNYSRSMTGMKEHFENDKVNLTGFASYDSLKQVVEEFFTNGTSGPFTLSNPDGVENSEKVELLVRDRNQPAVIVDIKELSRFTDYEFEPFTGQLLLKAPIPTLDSNLNPLSLRVTYEVNSGGERFWVGGGMGQVKVNNYVQVGGTFVDDSDPSDPNKLFAVNTKLKVQEKTSFTAEFAGTQHLVEGTGLGYRLEMQHDGDKLKGKAYFSRTDADFDNPTSIINKGRGESGVKASYALNGTTRLVGEFVRTEDVSTTGTLQGGELSLEKSYPGNIQTRFGFRHAEQSATPANADSVGVTPNSINSLISKLSVQVPHFSRVTASAEYEQDVENSDKRVLALGGNYQFWEKGKVYFRQELISSLGDVYSLNTLQHRNTTQVGIESTYYKDARVFSEYRIADLDNGREAEAAIGLRNNWNIAKGLAANTSIESIRALNGADPNGAGLNSLALTGALEYTAHENWKSSARMEWRGSATTDSILNTLGFAARLSDSWTFLGRNILSTSTTKGTTAGVRFQDRAQAGFALRDTERNRWNALSMVEFKSDRDDTQPLTPLHDKIGIFATTANYQVSAPFTLSGRYAAKWNIASDNAVSSTATTQLLGGRATYDLTRKWDLGVATSTIYSVGFTSRQYGLGFETGYQVIGNMWLSTGYNLVGFKDSDLAGEDITRRGAFLRMRFKFDENIFSPKSENKH